MEIRFSISIEWSSCVLSSTHLRWKFSLTLYIYINRTTNLFRTHPVLTFLLKWGQMYWNQCRFVGYKVVKYLPLKSNIQRDKAQLDVLIIICTCKVYYVFSVRIKKCLGIYSLQTHFSKYSTMFVLIILFIALILNVYVVLFCNYWVKWFLPLFTLKYLIQMALLSRLLVRTITSRCKAVYDFVLMQFLFTSKVETPLTWNIFWVVY